MEPSTGLCIADRVHVRAVGGTERTEIATQDRTRDGKLVVSQDRDMLEPQRREAREVR